MKSKNVVTFLFVLAVTGVVLWWVWPGEQLPSPLPTSVAAEHGERASELRTGAIGSGARPESAGASQAASREQVEGLAGETVGAGETVEAGETVAVLVGRCVDEDDRPLAGVTVHLHGWGRNREEVERHRLHGGEIDWQDPEDVVTAEDGRFEFRFEPPPPYQFTLDLRLPGRVAMAFRWYSLPAGESRDLGDVRLSVAAMVRGRVVDPDGEGQGGALVQAMAAGYGRSQPRPASTSYSKADPAGYFTFDSLPEGPVRFVAYRWETLEPTVPVTLQRPSTEVRIVAVPQQDDSRPSIRGVVLDESGVPILGAWVRAVDGSAERMTSVGRDGAFRLTLSDGGDASRPTGLMVTARGFEEWRGVGQTAWGTEGLEIRMRAGPSLTLRVTSAPRGEAVERYAISLEFHDERTGRSFGGDLLHGGDHENGVLRIEKVTPGACLLEVHAPETTGLRMKAPRRIDVVPGTPLEIEVVLQSRGERLLRLVSSDGAPVVGARVQLLEHRAGGEVSKTMRIAEGPKARLYPPDHFAMLVDEGQTDAAGELGLQGPAGVDLALRLPGPGNVPTIVQPVRLDEDGPLRIEVDAGATLRGALRPIAVLEGLRAIAPSEGGAQNDDGSGTVGLRLSRRTGEPMRYPGFGFTESPPVPVEADGSFEIRGIPPGTWNVELVWDDPQRARSRGVADSSRSSRELLRDLVLERSAASDVTLDIAALQLHEVPVRVRVDGEPRAATIQLQGEIGRKVDGRPIETDAQIVTGDDGKGRVRLMAGIWQASASVDVEGRDVAAAGPRLRVPEAIGTGIAFDVRLGRRFVQLLRPNGEPARGVVFQKIPGAEGEGRRWPAARPTDQAGRTTLHGLVERCALVVSREPLSESDEFQAWRRAHPRSDPSVRFLDLGEVDLLPGTSEELVLQLPQEWLELPK